MKLNLRLNPIMKKDIRVTSRSHKLSSGVLGCQLILFLFFCGFIHEISSSYGYISYRSNNIFEDFIVLFVTMAIIEFCIIALITPITTANLISGEIERQTFDILLTTPMTPFSIVFGKVATSVARILLYVIGSIPIMSLSFIMGGLSWSILFWFLFYVTIFTFFAGSIGVLCSSFTKKSVSAEISAFGFYGLFGLGTFIPMIADVINGKGEPSFFSFACLFFNPALTIEEFFMLSLGNESLFGSNKGYTSAVYNTKTIPNFFVSDHNFLIISTIVIILVTILLMYIAARRINPLYAKQKKKKKKK